MAEGEHKVRTREVAVWLQKVHALMQEVDPVLQKGEQGMQNNCLCGLCPKNCRSRYKQSKHAEVMKSVVDAELVQGHNFKDDVVCEPADFILERSLDALHSKMAELGSIFIDVNQQVKRCRRMTLKTNK